MSGHNSAPAHDGFLRRNRGAIMLSLVFVYLIAEPFVGMIAPLAHWISPLSLTILLICPVMLSFPRKLKWLGVSALIFYLLLRLSATESEYLLIPRTAVSILLDSVIVFFLIRHILTSENLTRDFIFAAMFVYLVMGFLFADILFVLQNLDLASFYVNNSAQPVKISFQDMLYFSFSTLTTAGYGDFTPATMVAKRASNIEACCGALYISVFIGRIIGIHTSTDKHRHNKSSENGGRPVY
jgi:hypothetical protein